MYKAALISNRDIPMKDLSFKSLSDKDVRTLSLNTMLTRLYLKHCRIGDKEAKTLATNTSLKELYLEYNQIGNEGAKALATNTSLINLNLSYNWIINDNALKETIERRNRRVVGDISLYEIAIASYFRSHAEFTQKIPLDIRTDERVSKCERCDAKCFVFKMFRYERHVFATTDLCRSCSKLIS